MEGAILLVAAVVAAVAIVDAVLWFVPAEHRGVVIRAGRVVRSRSTGPMLVFPWLERVRMVDLRPGPIDPLGVTALTRDGVEVRLVTSVLWRVVRSELAVRAIPDPRTAAAGAVGAALRHAIAGEDLTDLLRDRAAVLSRLPAGVHPTSDSIGVEVVDVELLDLEVRVGPELLRLLA